MSDACGCSDDEPRDADEVDGEPERLWKIKELQFEWGRRSHRRLSSSTHSMRDIDRPTPTGRPETSRTPIAAVANPQEGLSPPWPVVAPQHGDALETRHPGLCHHQRHREDRPNEDGTGRRDEIDAGLDPVGREQESLHTLRDGHAGGAERR